mgnify:CR=1 FL=1
MEKRKTFHGRQVGNKRLLPIVFPLFLFLLIPLNGYGDDTPMPEVVQQNSTRITGVVKDAYGEPVIGANVKVVGTTQGTITDFEGKFSINVSGASAKIKISFIGYKDKEVTAKKGVSLNIVLEEDAQTLGEVQVVAYGVQKKVSITGAISSMKGDDLLKTPAGSLSNVLSGQITGISSVQYSGEPGADAADIYVRGVATWNNAKPLIQVDGVERDFSQIDPNEIESVTVLKDASATAVFGVRGANGVILITTKRGAEGKAKVSFSTSAGVNVRTKDLEFANSYQYASYYKMKKYKILALAIFACVTLNGWAQSEDNVTGRVLDEKGKPVAGALVSVEENPLVRVATDKNGRFEITAVKGSRLKVQTGDDAMKVVKIENGSELTVVMDYSSEKVNYGFGLQQTNAESTGAVSTVYAENIDKSSAFSIGNSLYGNVLGLTTMQSTGVVWEQMPSMYIRGLKTLNGNNGILLVVDGLERDNNWQALKYITPEEVESVSVLRDAAALALYGYRGVNGVVNIVTKRGKYDTREINFSYDHAFNYMTRKPELADAYTYASALNEALTNDGKQVRYSQNELNAFKNGTSPYLYPNVNWWEEVFRDRGASDIATLSFRGGSTKMRYYTMMNLQNNRGFIKNFDTNADYSTQEKYSKANFRTNLDIDLSPKTKMQANIMGILNEFSRPGMGSDNLISKLYQLPSAAFPIRTESGLWGGNTTWGENWNPVALTEGRAYSKGHTRGLYADMSLRQDLSSLTKGLGASVRIGYDNLASYWENHTKGYKYGMASVASWENGLPIAGEEITGGKDTEMSGDSKLDWQYRAFNFQMNVDWQRQFGVHSLYSMLLYTYKYDNAKGINNTFYRQNAGWYTHYGFKNRYFADFTLMASASNLLAPDHRWNVSPTVGLAWLISNEKFMQSQNVVDFLKLRASFGMLNTDNIPGNGYWNETVGGGNGYPINNNFGGDGGWHEGRLASVNGTTEKAYKYNAGVDATLFKGLTLTVDGFYERRSDIWVSSDGQNSAVLGAK